MKLTRTVKYNYNLTEETLEKDIDSFISDARKGAYSWDYKNNGIGLKIIRQYFKIIQEKFNKNEFEECKKCYKKLIFFLINASIGEDKANFGYEDLLAKITKDFDFYVKNYFICLVNVCDIKELADAVSEYAMALDMYGFDSDKKILIEFLKKEEIAELEKRMLIKTENITKKDRDKQDILYFLLCLAQEQGDKEGYFKLCERFKGVLDEEELKSLTDGW